jgi:hypothetical protein
MLPTRSPQSLDGSRLRVQHPRCGKRHMQPHRPVKPGTDKASGRYKRRNGQQSCFIGWALPLAASSSVLAQATQIIPFPFRRRAARWGHWAGLADEMAPPPTWGAPLSGVGATGRLATCRCKRSGRLCIEMGSCRGPIRRRIGGILFLGWYCLSRDGFGTTHKCPGRAQCYRAGLGNLVSSSEESSRPDAEDAEGRYHKTQPKVQSKERVGLPIRAQLSCPSGYRRPVYCVVTLNKNGMVRGKRPS